MRLIYLDEAGIAANEPVAVVVGLVVAPDEQWAAAHEAIREVGETLPRKTADDFVSHATAIWNDKGLREYWPFDQRLSFLVRMMEIPRVVGIPVVVSMIRSEPGDPGAGPLRPDQFRHLIAFSNCVAHADDFIRRSGGAKEVSLAIAEDTPELRPHLRHAVASRKKTDGWIGLPEWQRPTSEQLASGVALMPSIFGINRLIDAVHFAAKREAPLLQIADACAFGFRRFLAGKKHGSAFAKAITGIDLKEDDWCGPMSYWVFHSQK